MNILVIGNGFDLAHGLPTRYTDFLKFTEEFMNCYQKKDEIDWVYYDTTHEINKYLKKMFDARYADEYGHISKEKKITQNMIEELNACIDNNVWLKFFLDIYEKQTKEGKDGWIDFEKVISDIIQLLDINMHRKKTNFYEDKESLVDIFSMNNYQSMGTILRTQSHIDKATYQEIRNILLIDLNKLIRALEIYLTAYLNEVQYGEELSIIKNIFEKKDEEGTITVVDTKILSFNYTATFKRIYKHNFDIDYIHGEADINNAIDTNNMVLGIDEYLGKKKRNKQVEFVAFKKFYQRIHKGTGCKYKDWINMIREENDIYMERKHDCEIYLDNIEVLDNIKEEMRVKLKQLNENPPRHNLYIFGHSLDVTDKDILRDLILNDNVYTTIFYHDKDVMGQQITNLVKVIGQDELIRRTGGSTKTIEFKPQQDMVPIDS